MVLKLVALTQPFQSSQFILAGACSAGDTRATAHYLHPVMCPAGAGDGQRELPWLGLAWGVGGLGCGSAPPLPPRCPALQVWEVENYTCLSR